MAHGDRALWLQNDGRHDGTAGSAPGGRVAGEQGARKKALGGALSRSRRPTGLETTRRLLGFSQNPRFLRNEPNGFVTGNACGWACGTGCWGCMAAAILVGFVPPRIGFGRAFVRWSHPSILGWVGRFRVSFAGVEYEGNVAGGVRVEYVGGRTRAWRNWQTRRS